MTRRVTFVTSNTERTYDENCNRRTKWTVLVAGKGIAVLARRCSSDRTRYALRAFPSIRSAPHFKRNRLSNAWSNAIPRKSRDVHEDFFMTVRKHDKTKTPIVVPLF